MKEIDIGKIGSIRRKIGLTQKELAKLSGVSQSLIAKIEMGKLDPAYSKVLAISEALENEMNKSKSAKHAKDIMSSQIISVNKDEKLDKVIKIIKERDISQLPVFSNNDLVGSISDSKVADLILERGSAALMLTVGDFMEESFPTVPPTAHLEVVANLLNFYKAVLVKDGKIIGIITKVDLIKALER